jgi:hypothetical protein
LLFLFLSLLENFFPSAVVHVGWRDVPDPFVIALMVVEFDELRHGRTPRDRAMHPSRKARTSPDVFQAGCAAPSATGGAVEKRVKIAPLQRGDPLFSMS